MSIRSEFRGFRDPLDVVDRTDMDYTERLHILQTWKAELAGAGAAEAELRDLDGAIHALEIGSETQNDKPAEAPDMPA